MQELFKIEDFSGGLVTEMEEGDLSPNAATDIKNFRIDRLGKLVKEPGASQIDDDSTLPDLPSGFTLENAIEWEVTSPAPSSGSSTQVTVMVGTTAGVDKLYMFPYYDPVTTTWVTTPGSWFELTEYVCGKMDGASTSTTVIHSAVLDNGNDDYYNTWIVYNFTRGAWSLVSDFAEGTDQATIKWAITGQAQNDYFLMQRFPLRLWTSSHHEGNYTTDTNTNTTTLIDTELESTTDDYYNGWDVFNITRAADAQVSDYVGSTQTLTHDTITGQVATDIYVITKSMFDPENTTVRFVPTGNVLRIFTGSDKGYPDKSDLWLSYIDRTFFEDADLAFDGFYLCPKNLECPEYHYNGIIDQIEELTDSDDPLDEGNYLINFSFQYDNYQESSISPPEDGSTFESEEDDGAGAGTFRTVGATQKISIDFKLDWLANAGRTLLKDSNLFSNRLTAIRIWMCEAVLNEIGVERNTYSPSSPWYLMRTIPLTGTIEEGEFTMNDPWHIHFNGSHIYVSDRLNNRILKIAVSDLSLTTSAGSYGSGNGEYNNPMGIWCDGTNVYVADYSNYRIVKLDTDLAYVSSFSTLGRGFRPIGLTGDGAGNLYISEWDTGNIRKYTTSGTYVSGTSGVTLVYPSGMVISGSYLYVCDYSTKKVEKITISTMAYYATCLSYSTAGIYGITVSSGNFYITDRTQHYLYYYDGSFVLQDTIGGEGEGQNQFRYPAGITGDDTYIYICDSINSRVVKRADSDISYVDAAGQLGEGWMTSGNSYTNTINIVGSTWTAGQSYDYATVVGHSDYNITANARFGTYVNNRFLIGNVYNEDDKYTSFIQISPFSNAGVNMPDVFPNTKYIALNEKGILNITGMVGVVNDVVVFGENDLIRIHVGSSSFDWDVTDTAANWGTNISNSILVIGSYVYFANAHDIFVYDLNQVVPISAGKISTTWQGVDSTSDFAAYHKDYNELWICTGTDSYIYNLGTSTWRKNVASDTYTAFWQGVDGEVFATDGTQILSLSSSGSQDGVNAVTLRLYDLEAPSPSLKDSITFTTQTYMGMSTKSISFRGRRIRAKISLGNAEWQSGEIKGLAHYQRCRLHYSGNEIDGFYLLGDPIQER